MTFDKAERRRAMIILFGLIAVALVAFVLAARAVLPSFWHSPPMVGECWDRMGRHPAEATGSAVSAPFYECRKNLADTFYKVDYAESKDLAKTFLTLLTALLAAFITFSEKIIDLNRAGRAQRSLMIACWVLLFSGIVACGTGLAFMTAAVGWGVHDPVRDFISIEVRGARLFILAGLCFGGGLAALLVSGIFAVLQPRNQVAEANR